MINGMITDIILHMNLAHKTITQQEVFMSFASVLE